MCGRIIAVVLSLSLVCVSPVVHGAPGDDKANRSVSAGPRRQLANIIFAGLAGAVLGLSTLSFYGRPQDKLNHIAIGAAVGVIGGTMFSTYKAASEPREFYGLEPTGAGTEETFALLDVKKSPSADSHPTLRYVFEF